MLRSVLAIATGFVLIGALATGTGALVQAAAPGAYDAAGRTESVPILLLTILYVGVIATAGCYLTARLAPSHPMRHALILGVLGLVFNIFGTMATWNTAPVWFHVVQLLLVMPWAWLGGWLRERQLGGATVPPSLAPRAT